MRDLAERLREVRVACGDWTRVLGDSVTVKHGVTGVFLDPPYGEDEHSVTYSAGTGSAASTAREWALANGDNPALRVALCGYDGEHDMPGWTPVAWKARGGYGSQSDGRGRENSARERIWFSPHCLDLELTLFGGAA
jgi:site-specific DNA-adenine methylase